MLLINFVIGSIVPVVVMRYLTIPSVVGLYRLLANREYAKVMDNLLITIVTVLFPVIWWVILVC